MSHPFSWDAVKASELIAQHATQPGALLPMLHALHEQFGYIADAAIPTIATALNISRAEVHGVVSFYHDFRTTPPGRHVLKLCRAEACQAMGGDALGEALVERLGVEWGGTTGDGRVTVEPVYCLGLCACGPAALMDGRPIGRLTGEALDRVLADCGP